MKVSITLETEAETVAAAVQQVLYAIDCEGGEDFEILEISGSPSFSESSTDMTVENSTVINNVYPNCHHDADQDVHLEGEDIQSHHKGRALPATLT